MASHLPCYPKAAGSSETLESLLLLAFVKQQAAATWAAACCWGFYSLETYRICCNKGSLIDVQISRDLIIVAGMGGVAGNAALGDHVHLEERAEYIGVIVQNCLLKLNCQLAALGGKPSSDTFALFFEISVF